MAPDGDGVACGDGPELLVYRGDGTPTWRELINGVLVGIAFVGDEVLTVDSSGRVQWWSRHDGAPLEEVQIVEGARRLAVAHDGSIAVLAGPKILVVPAQGQAFELDHPGASALSFGPDGFSLGVGTDTGAFTAIDLRSGGAWGHSQLTGSVGGVAWSDAIGQWVVTAGKTLNVVRGDAQAVSARLPADRLLGRLTVSADGVVAAASAGKSVVVFDLTSGQYAGEVMLQRAVHDVKFGRGLELGIGLDDAEASVLELVSGREGRTEPHPSRARTNWNLYNHVNPALLRGAAATYQAGGEPIAEFSGDDESDAPAQGGCRRRGCLWIAILLGVMVVGCGGLGLGYLAMQSLGPELGIELPF